MNALEMQRFSQSDDDFEARVCALTAPMEALDPNLVGSVRDIITEVRSRGDQALLEFTQRFDQHPAESVSELVFEGDTLKAFESRITAAERTAITEAALYRHLLRQVIFGLPHLYCL